MTVRNARRSLDRMTTTISFRLDDEELKTLDLLTSDGTSRSDAIREALRLAKKAHMNRVLWAEAEVMMSSPQDRAEVKRVQEELEGMRAR